MARYVLRDPVLAASSKINDSRNLIFAKGSGFRPSKGLTHFILPFEGKLNANNRWVRLAKIIPWEQIERDYADLFSSNKGTVAKPLRMALGSLIIKERCGFTDRETVEQITENPYLQYLIGLEKYQIEPPFDPSLMVYFRKRLDQKIMSSITGKEKESNART